jgi:hypothetical protein
VHPHRTLRRAIWAKHTANRTVQQTCVVRGVCEWALKLRRLREGGTGKVMVANRTREIRLSGMKWGAYGNVDYG